MRVLCLCDTRRRVSPCLCASPPNRMCLLLSIGLLFKVCVSVFVCHGFNNHVCSRGALECLSDPRRQGHDLTGVCGGTSWSAEQRHNALIEAWKETSEISQDPCEEGRSSGGTSTFRWAYKERHNYICIDTGVGLCGVVQSTCLPAPDKPGLQQSQAWKLGSFMCERVKE